MSRKTGLWRHCHNPISKIWKIRNIIFEVTLFLSNNRKEHQSPYCGQTNWSCIFLIIRWVPPPLLPSIFLNMDWASPYVNSFQLSALFWPSIWVKIMFTDSGNTDLRWGFRNVFSSRFVTQKGVGIHVDQRPLVVGGTFCYYFLFQDRYRYFYALQIILPWKCMLLFH